MTTLSELKLNPTQISALVVLMAEARPLSNPEMRDLAGFDLSSGRKPLVDLDLVRSEKKDGLLHHELTEYGWSKTRELLRIEEVRGSGKAVSGALRVLLNALARGFQERRLTPSGFFYRDPSAVTPVTAPEPQTDLEQAIRLAYKELAAKPGEWVRLPKIRAAMSSSSKADVDAALTRLATQKDVRIIPVANLKSLSDEDKEAAIKLGGEMKHAIAIEG